MSRGFLRWPQFHEEQLAQTYWRAGDSYGRIKIVISRGILNLGTGLVSGPQNLIVFAFQHAPMQILKSANIAWSSNGMALKPDRFIRSSGAINVNDNAINDMTTTETGAAKVETMTPWNTDTTVQNHVPNDLEPISDHSSSTLDENLDEAMDESPIKLGVAHIQPLEPRISNMISINSHTFTENPGTLPTLGAIESRIPRLSSEVPDLQPSTPQQGNAPQLGSPTQDNRAFKSEVENDTTATEDVPSSKRKPKATSTKTPTNTKRSKIAGNLANLSPTRLPKPSPAKITKPRKVSAKKSTIFESQTQSLPPPRSTSLVDTTTAAKTSVIDDAITGS